MSKMSTNQILGIILLVCVIIPFVPVVSVLTDATKLAIFLIALYLLIKK